MARPPLLSFLGAARTVTGSRFLVEHLGRKVLVDCGLFQGLKDLRRRNWEPFPIDPAAIDAVVLTHAHVDHSGWLPRLVVGGFRGPVLASPDTRALASIVLPDSGHLHEEEAEYANRMGFSKHTPALPLYTEVDARRSLGAFVDLPFGEAREIVPGIEVTLGRAGHILGSSTVRLRLDHGGPTVTFSGDLGRPSHPLLVPPDPIGESDWVVVESTYGDRNHDDARAVDDLALAIERTVARGGTVLIPAFAVDRTEVILHHLANLARAGRLPEVPVYVDSPMALTALDVYRDAVARPAADVRPEVAASPHPFLEGRLVAVPDVESSKRLNEQRFPSIIVSASGMATGGRIVHHLAHRLPDHRTTVVLVGFQAEGTRGRLLADGVDQVKMLGGYVRVRAEIVHLPAFSVHADQHELLAWLRTASPEPAGVFVVHGEDSAAQALAGRVGRELDWVAVAARPFERVRLDRRTT